MSEIRIPQWSPVDQLQIYYVGSVGSASNNGKSRTAPFNSLATAIAAVNGQTPSATNRFAIVFIGGFRAIGNFTLPAYTTTFALNGAEIVGTLTLDNPDSKVIMNKYTGPTSGSYGIHRGAGATGNAFVEIRGESNIGDFRAISNGAPIGNFYVTINHLVASPSSQPWYAVIENLGTGSNLFVKVNNLDASGGTANVVRPGAGNTYCEFGKVKSTSGAFIYTQAGDTGKAYINAKDVDASSGYLSNLATTTPVVHLNAQKAIGPVTGVTSNLFMNIGEGPTANKIVTSSNGVITANNQPYFRLRRSTTLRDVIGGNVFYTIPWDVAEADTTGGGISGDTFTAQVAGVYQFTFDVSVENQDATNNKTWLRIATSNKSYSTHIMSTINVRAPGNFWSKQMTCTADMDLGDTATCLIYMAGNVTADLYATSADTWWTGVLIA